LFTGSGVSKGTEFTSSLRALTSQLSKIFDLNDTSLSAMWYFSSLNNKSKANLL
jgi:hypothetical protein